MPMLDCTPRVNSSTAVLVAAAAVRSLHGLVRRSGAVLEVDGTADHRLDEDPREDECEHSGEGAGQTGRAR